MKKPHPEYLSQQRKHIASKIERLKNLYLKACNDTPLFHGQPGEVYRKCGRQNCRCVQGGTLRHGPYKIIRVFRDKKNTQITLTEDEHELFLMAQRYQEVLSNRKEVVTIQGELLSVMDELMDQRIFRLKAEWKKG